MLPEKTVHILLIEDSPVHIELIAAALATWDRQVELTVARSLGDGRSRLAEFSPDLTIVDLLLPDGRGTELLPPPGEAVSIPVLIMTSHGNEQEAVKAMKAGALDYLVKTPTMVADLPRVLGRALREWEQIQQRRLAEENLRQSEHNYRLLFENMTAGFALHDMIYDEEGNPADYRYLEVNPAFERLTGIPAAKIIGKRVLEVLPQLERHWIEVFGKVARSGEPIAYIDYAKELGKYYETWAFSPEKNRFAVVFTDITAKKRAEEALRLSEERWRSVFDTAAAGMVIISPDGKLQQVNPWLCRLTGYAEEELLGLTIEELTHPDDREKTSFHYDELYTGDRQAIHYEKRYLCKDGRIIWGHASVACVLDNQQRPLYCIGLVQDITERVQIEEDLRKANRELDSFVHTVSHDLRTPLTPIIGYAELLKEMSQEQFARQSGPYLDEICCQGKRMMALLEDMLALARIGQLERPAERIDVRAAVDTVIQGLCYQLVASNMSVATGALPCTRLPQTLLIQLFDNLISNAIRYAGPGGVIEVNGERAGALVLFSVRDHGPGIPAEERCRVFDLFYRCRSTAEQEGTGIGLATVGKIAQLYNGRAWVEETPGGGSTFLVEMLDEP